MLLTEVTPRGEFVRYCNRLALKRGVRVEMPLSEARTFARTRDRLVVEPVEPPRDRQALVELALRCERFSFCIGLEEAERPECILMDVTGIAHFFSGEQALAEELNRVLASKSYEARIAISNNIGSAWAAAHFLAGPQRPVVVPAAETPPLESLPVAGLRLPHPMLTKLHRLGIQVIRQLLVLDRAALVRRFGIEMLDRIDQFQGRRVESITPCRPLPKYRVERTLDEGIIHPEAIEQLWSRLLQRLLKLLAPKHLGMRHLECRFLLDDRTSQMLSLRFCEGTSHLRHISELLRIQQEKLRFSVPVVGLHLEALDVAPLEATQRELFAGGAHDHSRSYAMLLNRLSSRLGEEAVAIPRVLPDPVPERAVRLHAVSEPMTPTLTSFISRFHSLDRPTALFPAPRPVEVISVVPNGPPALLYWNEIRFNIAHASEPERIESGWWDREYVCRDYYRVATATGQWLWIFRRLQDSRWFWHGEFC